MDLKSTCRMPIHASMAYATTIGAATPASPTFVVRIGSRSAPSPAGEDGATRLGPSDVGEWLAAARLAATARAGQRRLAVEADLASAVLGERNASEQLKTRRSEAEQEAGRRLGQHDLVDRMRHAAGHRRDALSELRDRAEQLLAATADWKRIDDQRLGTEAALVSLWERNTSHDSSAVDLRTVVSDMHEAQVVLGRADRRRCSATESALDKLMEAAAATRLANEDLRATTAAWWGGRAGEQRFPLIGLLPILDAESGPGGEGGEATAEAAAFLDAARSRVGELTAELETLEREAVVMPDPCAVIREGLQSLPETRAHILDDPLLDLDGETVGAMLAQLPQALEGREVTYLTSDPRVLAWAVALPAEVGGVAGIQAGPPSHDPRAEES